MTYIDNDKIMTLNSDNKTYTVINNNIPLNKIFMSYFAST